MAEFDLRVVQDAARACRDAAHTFRNMHDVSVRSPFKEAIHWVRSLNEWDVTLRTAEIESRSSDLARARKLLARADRERLRLAKGASPRRWFDQRLDHGSVLSVYPWKAPGGTWTVPEHTAGGEMSFVEADENHPLVRIQVATTRRLSRAAKGDREGLGLGTKPTRDEIVQAYVKALLALADDIERMIRACANDDDAGETASVQTTPAVSGPAMTTLAVLETRSFLATEDIARALDKRNPVEARAPRTVRAHLRELQHAGFAEANAETKQGFRRTAAGSEALKAHARAER